jgi:FkbM family methyltransferase
MCNARPHCEVISDINSAQLPLKRMPGKSYLINAALGKERGVLPFHMSGAESTFASLKENSLDPTVNVTVLPLDAIIQEDVYLFKIDVQGFEEMVLQGAANLFRNHVVRQLIFEVDSKLLGTIGFGDS